MLALRDLFISIVTAKESLITCNVISLCPKLFIVLMSLLILKFNTGLLEPGFVLNLDCCPIKHAAENLEGGLLFPYLRTTIYELKKIIR